MENSKTYRLFLSKHRKTIFVIIILLTVNSMVVLATAESVISFFNK